MTHLSISPLQPAAQQKEISSLVHLLSRSNQEWASSNMAMKPTRSSPHAGSFQVESMHSKLDIMDVYASTLSMHACGKPKPIVGRSVHAIEGDDPNAAAPKNEYTKEMSSQFDGSENSVFTSSFADTRMSRKIGFSQNKAFLGYENPFSYSTLKLTMNVLNFFHASHIVSKQPGKLQMTEFESLMDVGTVLLKEGEQGLDGRLEVGVAARMLREAGARFASASAIDPSSLAAIDAWGITFLIHGKLKLLLTEKLRDMLLDAKAQGSQKGSNGQSKLSSIEEVIPKVCEECEKLLVEAGRKFGMAISLDQRDELALLNWGHALFYRARLIAADDLEDAAQDADKLYMAAIDKFKAATKFSKEYCGAAFLSWGLALRDQAWLHRSMITEERIKLLEGAQWASEQARQAYPDSMEAKCAWEACSEDLEQLQNSRNGGKGRSQSKSDWKQASSVAGINRS